jgi:DNA-binding transcriptional ArsR family regulator
MEELLHGRVMTATEAGELVGLSASAASHHLRVLERWGLVRRAKASRDGRERPWRSTGDRVNLNPGGRGRDARALTPMVRHALARLNAEVDAYLEGMAEDPWRDVYSGLSRAELWLTEEETRRLGEAIEAAVEPYAGRHSAKHPDGARRTAFTLSLTPLSPPPDD